MWTLGIFSPWKYYFVECVISASGRWVDFRWNMQQRLDLNQLCNEFKLKSLTNIKTFCSDKLPVVEFESKTRYLRFPANSRAEMMMPVDVSALLYHVSLLSGCWYDYHRNPNINTYRDHLVGQLTRLMCPFVFVGCEERCERGLLWKCWMFVHLQFKAVALWWIICKHELPHS